MPNGGPTPDCIHCQHFDGDVSGPWHCTYHDIPLAIPIRAFCASYVDPEPNDNSDWLDERLERASLRADLVAMMHPSVSAHIHTWAYALH